jgi:ribonuclease HI
MTIDIYTDGACKGNPGPGGWGAIVYDRVNNTAKELYGSEPHTTNNRMELTAAIEALAVITEAPLQVINLFTDSQYLCQGMRCWLSQWKKKGWRNATGAPVKNSDLWQQLDRLQTHHHPNFYWVQAHVGHPDNERADALANYAITNRLKGSS